MICFPNAKINLGLNVVSKQPNGYHSIETIFYPVPFKDALEVVEAETFSFSQTGIPIDASAEENLVVQALNIMNVRYKIPPLKIHLLKAIPFGAGLGGGSSDAANTLKLLNDFGKLNLSTDKLENLASMLGADCPFFIRNTSVLASGTGNIFEPISLSLEGYYICIVKPDDVMISTAEAYRMITPQTPDISLRKIACLPISQWKEVMTNDFEPSVFARYPVIAEIKERFYRAGAVYASMSGSGSSIYGLFDKPVSLKKEFTGCFVWEGELT